MLIAMVIWQIKAAKKVPPTESSSQATKGKGKTRPMQEFLPVDKVQGDGTIVLKRNLYRRILRVGNVNPYALSQQDGETIRENFRTMLSVMRRPFQFIVRGRRMDLTDYRTYFQDAYQKAAEKWESNRILEYGRHVEAHLVEMGSKQRTIRENLWVTTSDMSLIGSHDEDEVKRALQQETETTLAGLSRCKVSVDALGPSESIESLQIFLNRDRIHARARDAVETDSLRGYLMGDVSEEVGADVWKETQKAKKRTGGDYN